MSLTVIVEAERFVNMRDLSIFFPSTNTIASPVSLSHFFLTLYPLSLHKASVTDRMFSNHGRSMYDARASQIFQNLNENILKLF